MALTWSVLATQRCGGCGGAIGGRDRVAVGAEGQPMHYDCHRERLRLRCCVCRQLMLARPVRFRGRRIRCQPHVLLLGLSCGLQGQ